MPEDKPNKVQDTRGTSGARQGSNVTGGDFLDFLARIFSTDNRGPDNQLGEVVSFKRAQDLVSEGIKSAGGQQTSENKPAKTEDTSSSSLAKSGPSVTDQIAQSLQLGIDPALLAGIQLAHEGLQAQVVDQAKQEQDFNALMNVIRQNVASSRALVNKQFETSTKPGLDPVSVFTSYHGSGIS